MGFRKPFRAAPVTLGAHYRRKQRTRNRDSAARLLGVAAIVGAIVGIGSVATTPAGRTRISEAVTPVAVGLGVMRARQPQPGDHWRGCDDAQAAGTAPIYAGEPGYRDGLDGDSDGIACEPYR